MYVYVNVFPLADSNVACLLISSASGTCTRFGSLKCISNTGAVSAFTLFCSVVPYIFLSNVTVNFTSCPALYVPLVGDVISIDCTSAGIGSSTSSGGTTVPGSSGSVPGLSGSAPGLSGSVPGLSGSVPGLSGSVPGLSGSVPGLSGPGLTTSVGSYGSYFLVVK